MRKEAILHIPLSQYAYAQDEHTLVIRIRTGKDDIKKCLLYYGDRADPQDPLQITEIILRKTATDDLFDYFEGVISDRYTRVCYYFGLEDGGERLYYYSRGFCKKIECYRTEYFQFPYIRREDVHEIPTWAKELIMYQIFPDSFASEHKSISREGRQISLKNAKTEGKLGGTLTGIKKNLDYLTELGINCIYLNPIFTANSYHKYDTIDYFSVDPCLGTNEDLKSLVSECHNRGIRVILDGVFNHCGPDFFAFRDVLEKGEHSEYCSWFYRMPHPVLFQDPPNYESFAYVKEMPKLDTGNPLVADYLCKVGEYWIKEADIDGWRLDVANEINHDFWRQFRKTVHTAKKDSFLIAEIWEDSNVWLQGDQFDSSMNYTFAYLCRDFFAKRSIGVSEFDRQIHKMIMRYSKMVSLVQMNFLDTHDVPRFLSYCESDQKRFELALFYLFMGYGIPSVFYGDECYIQGTAEPEYRAAMDWEKVSQGITANIAKWIRLRKEHKALTCGDYVTIYVDDNRGLYVFARIFENEKVFICLNNSDNTQQLKLQDILSEKVKEMESGKPVTEEIILDALSGKVYIFGKAHS